MANETGLGKKQRAALDFIRRCNGWHSYANDVASVVKSLADRGLVEVSESTKQSRALYAIHCDQCEMLSINGLPCHETGCPNQGARYDFDSGEWIKQRVCFECGCTVDATDLCCNADESEAI